MSKDSLTTPDEQRDGRAPASSPAVETYGLPPHIVGQIMRLTPGDSEGLAYLMSLHRELVNAILMVAASHVGNAAVRRAIDVVKQRDAHGSNHAHAGSMNHQAQGESITDASDRSPIPPRDRSSFMEYPDERAPQAAAIPAAPDTPATPAVKQAAPAWVAPARAYNAAHPELVAEFNQLTASICCGDDNELDPQAVARWQEHHGLPGDGKVGPHTLAVARAARSPVAGPSPAPAIPV